MRLIFLCIAVSLLSPAAHAEAPPAARLTLNLSHDLVQLGIASRNLPVNDPSFDARPLFEAAVQYVRSHAVGRLTVDRGNYYFLTPQDAQTYLRFPSLSDLTIDLAGSKIYFAGAFLQGFALSNCNQVRLTNFEVDFLEPPYTQVELVGVDPSARTLTYRALPGWRDPVAFNSPAVPGENPASLVFWAVGFRDGDIVPGTSRMEVEQSITASTLRLVQDNTPWTQAATLANTFMPGDTIVVTERGGEPAVIVYGGDSITVSHGVVRGSSSMAVLLNGVGHSTVEDVRVVPRPGALISSNADGIHFVAAGADDHIRDCFVDRTLDDALAIDALDPATVVSQTGARELVVTRRAYMRFADGTAVNFVDPVSAREIPGATIIVQDPADSGSPVFNGTVNLWFDHDLPQLGAGFGMARADRQARGAGSSIERNVVAEVPFGRGIWIAGAEDVRVARNRVGPTSNGGIAVAQGTSSSFPVPPAQDIVIENNLVRGSLGPMASGSGTQIAVGAIMVESTGTEGFPTASPNTNISIRGNRIVDSGRTGIWVGQLDGGLIDGNTIIGWDRYPDLPLFGVNAVTRVQLLEDFSQPLVIHASQNVEESDNDFR